MDFRILGPLEVWHADRLQPMAAAKHRTLLAALLLHANNLTSTDRLIACLWDDEPPRTAVNLLQTYVSRLRKLLAADGDPGGRARLTTRGPGYQLHVDPTCLDLFCYEALVEQGRRQLAAGDPEQAAATLRAALRMWRGSPLSDITSTSLRRTEIPRLEECRLAALEDRIEADLQVGQDHELVGELEWCVQAYPLRERLRAQLMVALHRAGRQADALGVYQDARTMLVEEFGLEPGAELRKVQQAILRADPALEVTPRRLRATRAQPPTWPFQLPADIQDFTGRRAVIGTAQLVLERRPEQDTAVSVCVISGKAGVGKTALAVHVAHRLRPQFPDGQLYADLHGSTLEPVDPRDTLRSFLQALGVGRDAAGGSTEERMRTYRALLADRRILVVLDDAATELQIRPLLPGSPSCAVVVTSRSRLTVLEGARVLPVDALEAGEVTELLAKALGSERLAAEPEATGRLVAQCGGLPLAVRAVAARLAGRPHWSIARMVERLAEEHRRLDELRVGDLDVRASIARSYRRCGPEQRRSFRLLALVDAPRFSARHIAPLLHVEPEAAEELLDDLHDVHLVEACKDRTGRVYYRFHELVRIYARERLREEEPPAPSSFARAPGPGHA
jgi:DNA-binding SARP family transcriptional activator